MLAASRGMRNVKSAVRPSVSPFGAYSTCLTRGQHAARPAYISTISIRILRGRTYFELQHLANSLTWIKLIV